ncbi:MAG: hypothetical protein NXI24_23805 [bacterium]|nr:hypothetical protein [bacterium]
MLNQSSGSVWPRIPAALCMIATLSGCHLLVPLSVEGSYFCDLFEDEVCQDPRDDDHVYRVTVPEYKQDTWYNLGYHMYFHTRETPGIRLEFNRSLSADELETLEQNMHCSYEIEQGGHVYSSHLEGVRVDASGAWCFDYLGTMLVRLQKDRGLENERPSPEFFPVKLRLKYESEAPALSGMREGQVIVRWSADAKSAEKKGFN